MKTPNSLEEKMRSWTPRRPSPRIEQELFRDPACSREISRTEHRSRAVALPWYQTLGASLAGCAVVLFTILNYSQLAATQHGSTPFVPLSNHMSSMVLASAPVNTWTAPILGWTNDGAVGSTHRSFDLLNTNRPLH